MGVNVCEQLSYENHCQTTWNMPLEYSAKRCCRFSCDIFWTLFSSAIGICPKCGFRCSTMNCFEEIICLFLGLNQIQTDGTSWPFACCLSQLCCKGTAGVAALWAEACGVLAALYSVRIFRNLTVESRNFGISNNKIVKPDNSADSSIEILIVCLVFVFKQKTAGCCIVYCSVWPGRALEWPPLFACLLSLSRAFCS